MDSIFGKLRLMQDTTWTEYYVKDDKHGNTYGFLFNAGVCSEYMIKKYNCNKIMLRTANLSAAKRKWELLTS